MAVQLIVAFLVSLAVTAAVGAFLVPTLRRMKAGQSIREDGPVWHNKKQGTPTMGGIMFIAGIAAACVIAGFNEMRDGVFSHIFVLLFSLVYAAIGFLDDYAKLKKRQNLGLKARHKFALQLVVAVAFVLLLRLTGNLDTSLYIPFFNVAISVPAPIYYAFAAFVAVGTVNSVNITDGIDGLVTGVSVPVAVCFALVAVLWSYAAVGVFAASLAGGLVAFLLFNFHPAKVFMGDTGSLFLGGAICALAFAMDMPLILIPLGIVYFVETLSDIIQISYFKMTKGKRVFKMAPIHHHFEMCGWSEYKLFTVFTTVSVVFAALSYYGVYFRHS
jgi:phospho-N-acetylmuramoyl-pentapeptide-transferase